jgi:hypothetical protein
VARNPRIVLEYYSVRFRVIQGLFSEIVCRAGRKDIKKNVTFLFEAVKSRFVCNQQSLRRGLIQPAILIKRILACSEKKK